MIGHSFRLGPIKRSCARLGDGRDGRDACMRGNSWIQGHVWGEGEVSAPELAWVFGVGMEAGAVGWATWSLSMARAHGMIYLSMQVCVLLALIVARCRTRWSS